MIEIACPESCQYLRSAREQAIQREVELRGKELKAEMKPPRNLGRKLLPVVYLIDSEIAEAHRETEEAHLRNLTDSEIIQAVENAIKNLEIEDSGIIYEHAAQSPRVMELSRRIRQALDELIEEAPAEQRLRRSDLTKALDFTRETVEAHRRRNKQGESSSYLRYILLFIPWPEQTTKPLIQI